MRRNARTPFYLHKTFLPTFVLTRKFTGKTDYYKRDCLSTFYEVQRKLNDGGNLFCLKAENPSVFIVSKAGKSAK